VEFDPKTLEPHLQKYQRDLMVAAKEAEAELEAKEEEEKESGLQR